MYSCDVIDSQLICLLKKHFLVLQLKKNTVYDACFLMNLAVSLFETEFVCNKVKVFTVTFH